MSDVGLEKRGSRTFALSLLGVLVLAFLVHLPFLGEPFDGSLASWNGGSYMGRILRNWRKEGFLALRGQPCLSVVPGRHENLELGYRHHPPFFPWALRAATGLFGSDERGLRTGPAILSALSAALVFALVAMRLPLVFAWVAALIFAAAPMTFAYGRMANPESATLAFILLAVYGHLRHRQGTRVAYALPVVAFALATSMDWQGGFAFLVIAALELGRPRRDWRLRRLLVLGFCGALPWLASIGLFAWWGGEGVAAALREIVGLGQDVRNGQSRPGPEVVEWWRNQATFMRQFYGWGILGAAVLGSIGGFLKKEDRGLHLLGLLLVLPGILNLFAFPHHAFDHEFWSYYSLAGMAILAAVGVRFVTRRNLAAGVFLFVLVLLLAAWDSREIQRERRKSRDGAAAATALMKSFVRSDDLLVTAEPMIPESFYFDCWMVDLVQFPEQLAELVKHKKAGDMRVGRLIFCLPDVVAAVLPRLAEALPTFGPVLRAGSNSILIIP